MNAKRCDRCGSFYDSLKWPTRRVYTRIGERPRNIYIDDRNNDHIDLCDNCLNSLTAWWCALGASSDVIEDTLEKEVENEISEVQDKC